MQIAMQKLARVGLKLEKLMNLKISQQENAKSGMIVVKVHGIGLARYMSQLVKFSRGYTLQPF